MCGQKEAYPNLCHYCGGVYCANHILPENHSCTLGLRNWSTPIHLSHPKYSVTSPKEVRDILVAWLALGASFMIAERGRLIGGASLTLNAAVALVVVGSGFIMHEMMHKFVARRYGFWAEFRLWVNGLVLALITSTLGFVFAAPGATYVSSVNATKKQNGVISLAGPLTNVVVGAAFLPLVLSTSYLTAEIGTVGFGINTFLALFNMVPIMPLDGAKVFRWNRVYWAIVFLPLLIGFLVVFLGV